MRSRRIIKALGTVAAAASLAVAVPSAAQGGTGMLTIEYQYVATTQIGNPRGCYPITAHPAIIGTSTLEPAYLFTGPNCTGRLETAVRRGQFHGTMTAQSVRVL